MFLIALETGKSKVRVLAESVSGEDRVRLLDEHLYITNNEILALKRNSDTCCSVDEPRR